MIMSCFYPLIFCGAVSHTVNGASIKNKFDIEAVHSGVGR